MKMVSLIHFVIKEAELELPHNFDCFALPWTKPRTEAELRCVSGLVACNLFHEILK